MENHHFLGMGEESMEYDENMYMQMQLNEDYEPSAAMMLNDSMQVLDQENPLVGDENFEIEQVERETAEQVEEEQQEKQQPLYKLESMDTEVSINIEIKQLILARVSEEITSKTLEDMRDEAESEITNLKNKVHQLLNKTQDLDRQVDIDKNRIMQSEKILTQTGQVIDLVKENVDKAQMQQKECQTNLLLEKNRKLYKRLESLRNFYVPTIKKTKERMESIKTAGNARKNDLRTEILQKQTALDSLKKKHNELKKQVLFYNEEIEKKLKSKHLLRQKSSEHANECTAMENEFLAEENEYETLRLKLDAQISKLNTMKKERLESEQHLEEITIEVSQRNDTVNYEENIVSQRELDSKKLQEKLTTEENIFAEVVEELHKSHEKVTFQHNEVLANVTAYNEHKNELLTKKNALNNDYLKKCEEKVALQNESLKQQEKIHNIKTEIIKKQVENEVKLHKFEEMQNRYDTSVALKNTLEIEIRQKVEDDKNELEGLDLELKFAQKEHEKSSKEMKMKKEYLLANGDFLIGKSESLQTEVNESKKVSQNLEEEKKTLRAMCDEKQAQLNESKNKLEKLKNPAEERVLKSLLKTPYKENKAKKVKFNEILSFKSPTTSSDNSTLPVEGSAVLEASFSEWLQNIEDDDDEEN